MGLVTDDGLVKRDEVSIVEGFEQEGISGERRRAK